MTIAIDEAAGTLTLADGRSVPLYSDEGFARLSDLWLKVGWNQKHCYTFSWFGRPIIQHPDDMIRFQELVFQLRPDVIVETGIAHGGSLVYSASLLHLIGRGRVIGVDIEIRPHNRTAIEAHPLKPLITLIEGNAVAPAIIAQVRDLIRPGETVLVVLDSDHSRAHVAAELDAYGPLVTPGSYIIATDGIQAAVADVPRGKPQWADDNPLPAIRSFLAAHPEFESVPPPRPFDESLDLGPLPTHWPEAWLRRRG